MTFFNKVDDTQVRGLGWFLSPFRIITSSGVACRNRFDTVYAVRGLA